MNNPIKSIVKLTSICILFFACEQNSKSRRAILGQVEVKEINVASRLPGRISRVFVKPGQIVEKGEKLVQFEDDVLSAKKERALADIKAAESKKDITENAVRPEEKEQLQAGVNAARKQLEFVEATLNRMKKLSSEGAVSKQELEEIEFKWEASKAKYTAAKAKAKLGDKGARLEQKEGAAALVQKALTALKEVEAYEKDLTLVAPISGEVFDILSNEGELVPQGFPVVVLLKSDDPWVTVQVEEDQLARFELGKDVDIEFKALKDTKAKGNISYIAPMASFATRMYTQDRSSFDMKTYEVRVHFEETSKSIRPGMTAEIVFKRNQKI